MATQLDAIRRKRSSLAIGSRVLARLALLCASVTLLASWGCGTGVPSLDGVPGVQGDQGDQGDTGTGTTGAGGDAGDSGPSGSAGLSCWDANGNGIGDPDEDANGDGDFDALDCAGPAGEAGPSGPSGASGEPGLACWDLNGDGIGDADEDANGDGDFNALDCVGAPGEPGPRGAPGPQGEPGLPGLSCWDLNEDGVEDPEEDVNEDGVVDVLDCAGPEGKQGPAGSGGSGPPGSPGLSCWDLNGNHVGDPEEDLNEDGVFDTQDCVAGQSSPGLPGLPCWDLNGNGVGDPEEDSNEDGVFDALDCAGTPGLSCWDLNGNGVGDPEEDANEDGVFDTFDCASASGEPGTPGLSCWDLNGNHVGDPEEDVNEDGVFDALDCSGIPGAPGVPGAPGEPGAPGQACWDINGNGIGDPEEDINEDGVVDLNDCCGGGASVEVGPGLVSEGGTISLDIDFLNGAYWTLGGNTGTDPGMNFLGTADDTALEFSVNGARAVRLEPTSSSPNLIGGHAANSAGIGVVGATIGGGGDSGEGEANVVAADYTAVAGGIGNAAQAYGASVPGGANNTASGVFSLAAGQRAKAVHDGSFVWADSAPDDFSSLHENQFRVRADGGARFDVNSYQWVDVHVGGGRLINTSSNAHLTLGGIWTNASDRRAKYDLVEVDGKSALATLREVPIYRWSHVAEEHGIRHMGPMAQDFYAAFELGLDNEHIPTIDAEGVALAAIQGLDEIIAEQKNELATQRIRINELETQVGDLVDLTTKLNVRVSWLRVQIEALLNDAKTDDGDIGG